MRAFVLEAARALSVALEARRVGAVGKHVGGDDEPPAVRRPGEAADLRRKRRRLDGIAAREVEDPDLRASPRGSRETRAGARRARSAGPSPASPRTSSGEARRRPNRPRRPSRSPSATRSRRRPESTRRRRPGGRRETPKSRPTRRIRADSSKRSGFGAAASERARTRARTERPDERAVIGRSSGGGFYPPSRQGLTHVGRVRVWYHRGPPGSGSESSGKEKHVDCRPRGKTRGGLAPAARHQRLLDPRRHGQRLRAASPPTRSSCAPSSRWGSRSRARTSFPPTSRVCRPGSRSGPPRKASSPAGATSAS